MAKKSSPWYWQARNGWYVTLNGKRYCLGLHPDVAKKPEKSKKTGRWNSPPEIDQAYRNLLSTGSAQDAPADDDAVVNVLDDFVVWSRENRAKLTAARYAEICQDFVTASDGGIKFGALNVNRLTSKHVTAWLNQRPSWGSTTKRNAITALIRGFNWAVKNRGLQRNPIAGMEKPEARRRKETVSVEEFEAILKKSSRCFADLLTVSYDSGARPFEIKELEARHCQLDEQRAVIPADEAKGRQRTRVFYFPTERSISTIRRLCGEYPTGPLFRNNKGNKWTSDAVKCTFARLEKTLGRRITHYSFRRTFITRKIIAGVDSHVVATLSGHQSTAMIDKHYSAVAKDHGFLLQQAKRDINPDAGAATS